MNVLRIAFALGMAVLFAVIGCDVVWLLRAIDWPIEAGLTAAAFLVAIVWSLAFTLPWRSA